MARVIDGDSFELADGRQVRVLGIDSCEMGTYGGQEAKSAAESSLTNPHNQPIALTAQPGVDLDDYGRQLRYVTMDGRYDFGESMVKYDHTGVYQGRNDASPAYLQRLYDGRPRLRPQPARGPQLRRPLPAGPVDRRLQRQRRLRRRRRVPLLPQAVVVLTMRSSSAIAKLIAGILVLGLVLLILKWVLITVAILVVPFGIWWMWDRTRTPARHGTR